ncbi:MAG: glycosyltransferase family 4 protein [Leptolyngbyaceae cyanobacterium SM1_3_5]|nr:glycosyltransferase family 4 protein [Leptolyngbyaceae cyanobacterium SM1_3_5]
MLQVVFPIHLDRWKFPVSTSLRELALRNPDIEFYSFSKPVSEEDEQLGKTLWEKPNVHQITPADLLKRRFDIVHHASATPRNLLAASLAKARSFGQCVHLFTAPIQPHDDDEFYRQYVTSVRRADVLAAVSHAVASDIQAQFARPVDAVIPSGVDLEFFSPTAARSPDLEKLGIRQPYVLFVGVLTARKTPRCVHAGRRLFATVRFCYGWRLLHASRGRDVSQGSTGAFQRQALGLPASD